MNTNLGCMIKKIELTKDYFVTRRLPRSDCVVPYHHLIVITMTIDNCD